MESVRSSAVAQMVRVVCWSAIGVLLLNFVSFLHAAESIESTRLMQPENLIFSDDFNTFNTNHWERVKGEWSVENGTLRGAEIPAQKHNGVIRAAVPPFKDCAIRFDLCFDGCSQVMFRIMDEKEYVVRIHITTNSFVAYKDDHDHDGPDKAIMLAKAKVSFDLHQWKPVLIEIADGVMTTTIDGVTIKGTNDLFKVEKSKIGFRAYGSAFHIKNIKVWSAGSKP